MNKYKVAYIVFCVFVLGVVFFAQCFSASELTDVNVEDIQDDVSSLEERVNSLEIRLEELGYTIDELNTCITAIAENTDAMEEERLSLSQDMELLIVGMNALIEQNNQYLDFLEQGTLYQETVTASLSDSDLNQKEIVETLKLQSENTVSGNSLINNTLIETKEISDKSNETITAFIIIGLGLVLGIGSAFMLAKGLFRNGN